MTSGTYSRTGEAAANRPPAPHADFAWTPENAEQAMEFMCKGHMLADAPAILGSIDIVFGECDR